MLKGIFGNLIFAIIARMLCQNHLNGFGELTKTANSMQVTIYSTQQPKSPFAGINLRLYVYMRTMIS